MQVLRTGLKVILWVLPLLFLAHVLQLPLLFLEAQPVTAKLLHVRVIQERHAGYNGRGGRGSLRPFVSFEHVTPQGGVAIGQCFSTSASGLSESEIQARIERLEQRVGQAVPAYRSSVDGSTCLFRDNPWQDIALALLLLGIAAAIAHSQASPLNRAHDRGARRAARSAGSAIGSSVPMDPGEPAAADTPARGRS